MIEEDLPTLLSILREPSVLPWWGAYDLEHLRRDVLEETESFAIEFEGEVVGLLMVSEETDPQYGHAGLDIALDGADQDRGLGQEVLRTIIDHLIRDRGRHRITIDPAVENERAIRCYCAVGFQLVGVMRRYERGPDGVWRDGLLLDLVVEG